MLMAFRGVSRLIENVSHCTFAAGTFDLYAESVYCSGNHGLPSESYMAPQEWVPFNSPRKGAICSVAGRPTALRRYAIPSAFSLHVPVFHSTIAGPILGPLGSIEVHLKFLRQIHSLYSKSDAIRGTEASGRDAMLSIKSSYSAIMDFLQSVRGSSPRRYGRTNSKNSSHLTFLPHGHRSLASNAASMLLTRYAESRVCIS